MATHSIPGPHKHARTHKHAHAQARTHTHAHAPMYKTVSSYSSTHRIKHPSATVQESSGYGARTGTSLHSAGQGRAAGGRCALLRPLGPGPGCVGDQPPPRPQPGSPRASAQTPGPTRLQRVGSNRTGGGATKSEWVREVGGWVGWGVTSLTSPSRRGLVQDRHHLVHCLQRCSHGGVGLNQGCSQLPAACPHHVLRVRHTRTHAATTRHAR